MSIKDQILQRAATFMASKPDLSNVSKPVFTQFIDQYSAKLMGDITYIIGCPYVIDHNKRDLDPLMEKAKEMNLDVENFVVAPMQEGQTESEEQSLVRKIRELQYNIEVVEKEEALKLENVDYYIAMLEVVEEIKRKVG